jgi:hypothetical protein
MRKKTLRAAVEMASIVFLFYANLVMGEFTHSGVARDRGLVWAIRDVVTPMNFAIAAIAALIGYLLFEYLRERC